MLPMPRWPPEISRFPYMQIKNAVWNIGTENLFDIFNIFCDDLSAVKLSLDYYV